MENPPNLGFYKLQIFGVKKPRKCGKLKIPLIANFLVDFRHTAGLEDPTDTVMSAAAELMSSVNRMSSGSGINYYHCVQYYIFITKMFLIIVDLKT